MGILAVHITTAKIRDTPVNKVSLGRLGHPGKIGCFFFGVGTPNDVTMEAVRAYDYFPTIKARILFSWMILARQLALGILVLHVFE